MMSASRVSNGRMDDASRDRRKPERDHGARIDEGVRGPGPDLGRTWAGPCPDRVRTCPRPGPDRDPTFLRADVRWWWAEPRIARWGSFPSRPPTRTPLTMSRVRR